MEICQEAHSLSPTCTAGQHPTWRRLLLMPGPWLLSHPACLFFPAPGSVPILLRSFGSVWMTRTRRMLCLGWTR